jgi:hypothetical protein
LGCFERPYEEKFMVFFYKENNKTMTAELPSKKSLVSELLEEAQKDPTLLSLLDIDDLLDKLETPQNDFLENETSETIFRNVVKTLRSLPLPKATHAEYASKLIGYRVVDELHLLHRGKHIRWIRREEPYALTVGGIVVSVQFEDAGPNVVCRLFGGRRFMKLKFNECTIFQKLNGDETLILLLQEELAKSP